MTREEIDNLYTNNQGLAIHVVLTKYNKFNKVDKDDFLQEAKLALWKAANEFDETRGVKFSSYAIPYISAAVATAAREAINSSLYYPKSLKTLAAKLLKHYGNVEEIIKAEDKYTALGSYTKESIDGAIQFLRGSISLSSATGEGTEFNLLDIYADTSVHFVEDVLSNDIVNKVLNALEKEEQIILLNLMDESDTGLTNTQLIKFKHKIAKLYERIINENICK